MLKKILLGILILIALSASALWFAGGGEVYELFRATSVSTAPADYALQDDSRVTLPTPQPYIKQPYNAFKNVYWGDLHVHTEESFDAVLFGTTLTIEDAYRFAQGESLRNAGGELMQLSRPLDFMAITDHAESFGLRTRCGNNDLSLKESLNCWLMETPNVVTFLLLKAVANEPTIVPNTDNAVGVYRNRFRTHPTQANFPICTVDETDLERCYRDSNSDWAKYKSLADKYNQPGTLTVFSAYEYSPPLPDSGKHHRNVIFNGADLPRHATSYFDVGNAIELWRTLEKNCSGKCDFLTIPHNMNKGWGLFYSENTWDGEIYDEEGWRLRQRREPLAEIYQVKGSSECALGVGAADEECGFGQVLEPCQPGQESGCAFTTSFTRQGLKIGLKMQTDMGFNPFAFGLIGSTDTHNASPGDAEEWDFVGKVAAASSPAARRLTEWPGRKPYESILQFHTGGGLTGVWAEENTRDAIFSSMQRREAYATSGPRIALRFFAGWGFNEDIVDKPDAIALAVSGGVPMGGVLMPEPEQTDSPTFFVWATADLMSAPLQRLQMIKGWIDTDGNTHESVRDISCSDGLPIDTVTLRCPDNGASVNIATCEGLGNSGASQMSVSWKDPDYHPDQNAFYYVRALQNPTCRWSTYDALRLGQAPPAHVPATIRERAWSSPIWIEPAS
ncbi:MAG: DUF3604 domain-containing protein [Halioglobus sp.]|nr:DUF3604 domain-containing protein [Halioglobus sp.]